MIGNTETMEHFIFILMITGMSASLSTNITGGIKPVGHTVRECDKEGLMCQDCSTLVYCQNKDFDFVPITVSQCSVDMPCDETKKACTVGGACRYKEFVCPYNLPKPQMLPDPYSCRQYWWCNDGILTPRECGIPSSYNPISTECDLLMQDSQYCLQGPIPPCQYNGQNLNMKGTPFNYECVETLPLGGYPIIYPYLRMDPNKPTETTKPINPTGSPTTTKIPDPSYVCKYDGFFPYPPDCTKFYKCVRNPDGTFTQTWLQCRNGSYFDKKERKCVSGKCPNARH
ncbi:hypothetical protein J437_LFUL016805 [Ladona fulva]|uniref:Chitin-binding type-2 domain-containing protein n=1 Tax=Ladona fulva TaxID=123851 RepID=A0A8K0NUS4_LADFU|nr:hypothetical protein J437_LFUL016805 [Ladona fulva]